MLKACQVEACADENAGSIGAFYVRHHAQLAGCSVDVLRDTADGYDVELISVHHCEDFVRLANLPKRARWRLVGGHPMANNPRPCIPYADAIGIGEGETWIKRVLMLLDQTGDIDALKNVPGTIVCHDWQNCAPIPAANVERPLPDNPPYLNWAGTRSAAWYVELSRGCVYKCAYCELGHSTPYRAYDANHLRGVIDQIDVSACRKINLFGPEEAGNPHYDDIMGYVRKKGFSAGFSSMRVDAVLRNPPDLKANHLIRVGIDGLTETTRIRAAKPLTDQMIADYFKLFIDRGHVNFKMFMMFAYPWETLGDFDKWAALMDRVMSLPLRKNVSLRIKWTPLIPQPCTPLRDASPNYDDDMVDRIKQWHAAHRSPVRAPGWHVECDGIMSRKSHADQCALTSGDEHALLRRRDVRLPSWHGQYRR